MVACLKQCQKFFRMFDFFQSSKLLRYNGDAEYKSTSGGVITVMVVGVLVALFFSMGLRTIRKEIIFYSSQVENQIDPSPFTATFGSQDKAMFALYIYGMNLTAVPKLFDINVEFKVIKLIQITYQNGIFTNSTPLIMEPCTVDHFNASSDVQQLGARFANLLSSSLCPQPGQTFTLQGVATSEVFKILNLNITRCNSTIDPTCLNDTMYAGIEATVGKFLAYVSFLSTNINPGSQQYRKLYIADQNRFYFNSQLGSYSTAGIAQDTIKTDTSLMPFQSILEEKVMRLPKPFVNTHFMTNIHSNLAEIYLLKSSIATTYERSFNKADTYLSYVGGLVGTIISLIFIMEFYTEKAYEVSIAKKVMLDNEKEQISSRSFNIFYYFSMMVKSLLKGCKVEPDWPKTNLYYQSCEEMSQQLDVTYIVKKIMFFDAAISKLLGKDELQRLYLRPKPTLSQVKEQRVKFSFLQILKALQGKYKGVENQSSGEREKEGAGFKEKQKLDDRMWKIPVNFGHRQDYSEDVSAMSLSKGDFDLQMMGEGGRETIKSERRDIFGGAQGQLANRARNNRQPSILVNQIDGSPSILVRQIDRQPRTLVNQIDVNLRQGQERKHSKKVKDDKGFRIEQIRD